MEGYFSNVQQELQTGTTSWREAQTAWEGKRSALFHYVMFQPRPASQGSQVRQCTKAELWRDWEHVNRGCPGVLIPVQEWHPISLVVVRRIRNGMAWLHFLGASRVWLEPQIPRMHFSSGSEHISYCLLHHSLVSRPAQSHIHVLKY